MIAFASKGMIMICVVDGTDACRFPALFDAADNLCRRSRRPVAASCAGVESRFRRLDHNRGVHHFCIENGKVVGYQCMLPTLGPMLLDRLFPSLCEGSRPRAADVYELALHHISEGWREGQRALSQTGAKLIAGCLEWGLAHGISKIIVEAEAYWVLRALQLGFDVRPLGHPRTIGSRALMAIELGFDAGTLEAVREYRGDHTRVAYFYGLLAETETPRAYAN
jgi:acyl-homoserine lactone synthase